MKRTEEPWNGSRARRWRTLLVTSSMVIGVCQADAAVVGYVNNPTNNSGDWTSAVAGLGGVINSSVNFNAHSTGALNGAFYAVSDGVTLTGTEDFTTVGSFQGVAGASGPANGNSSTTPTSTGEGLNGISQYLGPQARGTNSGIATLTIDFASAVVGVGLTSIDLYDPAGSTVLQISAYTGVGGTGTLLGSFTNAQFNFQNNYTYFMGVTSSDNDIRSLVVTHNPGTTGDTIGLDDIVFATKTVPEPGMLALLGVGFAGLVATRRRRQ